MSAQLTRDEAYRAFSKGKPDAVIPEADLAKALQISGSFPTEAYTNSLPSNAGEQSTFRLLEVLPLSMSFDEALSTLVHSPGEEILIEDLAYALQGCAEPLSNDQADELVTLAREKCSSTGTGINIACLVKAVHEYYSATTVK